MIRTERVGPSPILCVDVAGAGDLVILLHGVGGGRTSWRRQMQPLGERFLVAAVDARGYGDSEDYDGPLALADLSNDVVRVIRHFGRRSAHLVGLSMGGRIALDVLRRAPDVVRSLVLADTSAGHPAASDPAQVEAALQLRVAPLLAGQPPSAIAPEVVAAMAGPSITDEARAVLLESVCALHPESYVKTMRCLTQETDFLPYEAIPVPTLVINGSEDRIAKAEVAKALSARIPDHRLVILDGVGHVSNVEAPDRFNEAVLAFLSDVAARPERGAPMTADVR